MLNIHNFVVDLGFCLANAGRKTRRFSKDGWDIQRDSLEVNAITEVEGVIDRGQLIRRTEQTVRHCMFDAYQTFELKDVHYLGKAVFRCSGSASHVGGVLDIYYSSVGKVGKVEVKASTEMHVHPTGLVTIKMEVIQGSKTTTTYQSWRDGQLLRQRVTTRTDELCGCCWTETSDETTREDGQVVHVVTESSQRYYQLVEKTFRKEVDGLLVEETSCTDDRLGAITEETRTFHGGLLVNRVKIVTQPMEGCVEKVKTTEEFARGKLVKSIVDTHRKFDNGKTWSKTVVDMYEGGLLRSSELTSNSHSIELF